MSLSARLAIESPWITTDVINVTVLPYLAVRYHADDTPTTVVNGRKACVGFLEEDELVSRLLAAGEVPAPRTRARRRRREGRTRP